MPKLFEELWSIQGLDIPVHFYRERRLTNRISIARQKVIIRISLFDSDLKSIKLWANQWLNNQFVQNPTVKNRFIPTAYSDGHTIETPRAKYRLIINHTKEKSAKAKLNNGIIYITVNDSADRFTRSNLIQTLVGRIIAHDQIEAVSTRIHELNHLHINRKIDKIRIKNNKSNWGSCSTKGNINISSRTLLVPLEIQDYIYIHELAHLIELNHSNVYWDIVHNIDPNYKEKERWLNEKGQNLTF